MRSKRDRAPLISCSFVLLKLYPAGYGFRSLKYGIRSRRRGNRMEHLLDINIDNWWIIQQFQFGYYTLHLVWYKVDSWNVLRVFCSLYCIWCRSKWDWHLWHHCNSLTSHSCIKYIHIVVSEASAPSLICGLRNCCSRKLSHSTIPKFLRTWRHQITMFEYEITVIKDVNILW